MLSDRLRIARKRTGMSLRALEAAMSGKVSAQALSKYERGDMTPSSDVLLALSRALDVPIPYLLAVEEAKLSQVDFRTKASTSAKDRARVEAAVLEWVERYLQLERILESTAQPGLSLSRRRSGSHPLRVPNPWQTKCATSGSLGLILSPI